eukprot:scaffold117941_cov60-Attheya_sp.AAC.3
MESILMTGSMFEQVGLSLWFERLALRFRICALLLLLRYVQSYVRTVQPQYSRRAIPGFPM